VFINIIPVDPSLSKNELAHYLHWEVEQYFTEVSPKVFITDSHGLPIEKAGVQQTFMVSVRRGMVAFLQRVVAGLNMKLNIVDIDQFSTEKTLIVNYPEILQHDIVLFGVRDAGVDASLIHNGEMTDYRAFPYDGEQNPDAHILNYLKYLKQKNNSTPAALLLYGVEVTKDMIISLRKETGIKQTLPLDVFRKVRGADKLSTPLVREGYRFAAAIGLALRGK
jgi:Tfp pilus assembly PilM family ATPase